MFPLVLRYLRNNTYYVLFFMKWEKFVIIFYILGSPPVCDIHIFSRKQSFVITTVHFVPPVFPERLRSLTLFCPTPIRTSSLLSNVYTFLRITQEIAVKTKRRFVGCSVAVLSPFLRVIFDPCNVPLRPHPIYCFLRRCYVLKSF
jgi:hypothetical protein